MITSETQNWGNISNTETYISQLQNAEEQLKKMRNMPTAQPQGIMA